jgi:hypothetical protein
LLLLACCRPDFQLLQQKTTAAGMHGTTLSKSDTATEVTALGFAVVIKGETRGQAATHQHKLRHTNGRSTLKL